jgi:uncharacterized tellurite resistance protein B-like protein
MMRTYDLDSPKAAARIVALTMLADGHISQAELSVLQGHGGCERLGLEPDELQDVLLALCEDLLHGASLSWTESCCADTRAIARLLGEITDPALRERVLALCLSVAEADNSVSDGEALVLTYAVEQWGLQHRMLAAPANGLAA